MRVEQLTFTRFAAAISIVVFHHGATIAPFNTSILSNFLSRADTGVSYFFMLSGFVMVVAYRDFPKVDWIIFTQRRTARILPLYFFALALLVLNRAYLNQPIEPYELLVNFLLVQTWIPETALSLNFPGWSLSVEMFFYFAFPLLLQFIRKKTSRMILIALLLWVSTQILFHVLLASEFYEGFPSNSHNLIFYFPLMHLNQFLIGMLTGYYFLKNAKKKEGNYDLIIIALVVLIVCAYLFAPEVSFHNGLLLILFAPFVFLLSVNNGVITKLLKLDCLVFLGKISYGVYILQIPAFKWSRLVFEYVGIIEPSTVFYLSLLILITLSAMSYRFIEKPLREKIRRLKF